MGKCFVTKLNGVVDNDSLLKINEIRFKIIKNESQNVPKILIGTNKETTIKIIGDGYFTNDKLSENRGKTMTSVVGDNTIYLSNNNLELSVEDKFCLTKIISSTSISIDISSLKHITNLIQLNITGSQVTGDILSLKNLTGLVWCALSRSQITGDIAAVKDMLNVEWIDTAYTNITGNINALDKLTKLKTSSFNRLTGNILSINNTKLTSLVIRNSGGLTGDIAKLNPDVVYIGLENDTTSRFTWSSRSTESKIFGNDGTPIIDGNLDNMLINMAKCQNGITSSTSQSEKRISYAGTRTSASDEAVQKLQEYGYTVIITKV